MVLIKHHAIETYGGQKAELHSFLAWALYGGENRVFLEIVSRINRSLAWHVCHIWTHMSGVSTALTTVHQFLEGTRESRWKLLMAVFVSPLTTSHFYRLCITENHSSQCLNVQHDLQKPKDSFNEISDKRFRRKPINFLHYATSIFLTTL
jgi:hypothetical protein